MNFLLTSISVFWVDISQIYEECTKAFANDLFSQKRISKFDIILSSYIQNIPHWTRTHSFNFLNPLFETILMGVVILCYFPTSTTEVHLMMCRLEHCHVINEFLGPIFVNFCSHISALILYSYKSSQTTAYLRWNLHGLCEVSRQ